MTISIEWECSIPTHLVIHADKFPKRCHKIDINIGSGFQYVMKSKFPNNEIISTPTQILVSYLDDNENKYTRKDYPK